MQKTTRFLIVCLLIVSLFLPSTSFAVSKIYGFTSLTGGGSGALDAIDGTVLADKDIAVGVVSGIAYEYWLDADSALAESSSLVIAPNANAGNKRWIRSSITNDYTVDTLSYGQTLTKTTIEAALTAIGTTNKTTLLLRPGTWVISADADWSTYANVTFKIVPGAILQVATGTTTTFGGPVEAGLYQIFSGDGTVILGTGSIDKYPVQWRGAVGDDSTDNYDAITAANRDLDASNNSSNQYRPILWFPPATGYRIETGVVINAGIDVEMDAPIRYVGAANAAGTALTVGESGRSNFRATMKLNVERVTQSDWTSATSIGIKIINADSSKITIVQAANYTKGVIYDGIGRGFAYNEVIHQYIYNNKYGVVLTEESTGWCNENSFYGGRFSVDSTVNTAVSRYGVLITSDTSAVYQDGNTFYKPSFELAYATLTGAATSVPIAIDYGLENAFYDCRTEDSGPAMATVANGSYHNYIGIGYGYGTITDTSTYNSTLLDSRLYPHRWKKVEIFNSGAMHKTAGYYNATYIHIPRVHAATTGDGSTYRALASITPASTYLEYTSTTGVGVFVDTSVYKRFIVNKDCVAAYGGRVYVVAYDSAGTILSGSTPYYVVGTPSDPFGTSTSFGNSYTTGSDSVNETFFVVHADVKKIRVILLKGTANLRIRSFSIISVDGGSPAVWAGYEEIIPGAHLATQSPTLGTMWSAGSTVYTTAPAASGAPGWVCVFKLETTLTEDVSISETADITLTSIASVTAGDIVGILLDDGTIYWDTVGDVTGGDLTLAGAGPASLATSGNAVYFFRFKAMANLGA